MRILVIICSLLLPLTAAADQFDHRLVHTNGYGEVKVKPDMAKVSLSVTAIHKEALNAKQDVDKRVNNFLKAVQKMGVKEKDIVASRIRTHPQYEYKNLIKKRAFTGYNATRNLTITIRKLEQLTDVMDLALEHKIQNIGNVSYESSEADKHIDQARQNAINNSKRKAEALAKAYGAKLGNIVSINYYSNQANFGLNSKFRAESSHSRDMAFAAVADQGATYLPDEITFSDNIQVVFDLIVD